MDTDELKCEKCSEPLALSGRIDGREIDVGVQGREGQVQSAKFDLKCRCCGYLNALEFVFEEDERVHPH